MIRKDSLITIQLVHSRQAISSRVRAWTSARPSGALHSFRNRDTKSSRQAGVEEPDVLWASSPTAEAV